MEEVWNAIHTAEKRNAERNGTSTPPLDQQQTVGSFLQSIGALDFASGDLGIPSSFLPPAPELQVSLPCAFESLRLCQAVLLQLTHCWRQMSNAWQDSIHA